MKSSQTLQSNFVKIVKEHIREYEQVKQGIHPRFKFVTDFYRAHNLTKQNFIKYYHRYMDNPSDTSLIPQKRGRKYGSIKTDPLIIAKIQELRSQGFGKYDIYDTLEVTYGGVTPSITTIYNVLKRYGISKPSEYLEKQKRRYVKEKIGELAHVDCHYIERGTVEHTQQRYYLLCVTDDHTRLSYSCLITSLKATVVSHNLLKLLSLFKTTYGITFTSLLSDNGPEFKGDRAVHPTELLLIELHIIHKYTKPYRPQTNGKVERYWRSIEAEVLRESIYTTQEALEEEIYCYSIYYNHLRKHHGIQRQTPYAKLQQTRREEQLTQQPLLVTNLSP